MAMHLAETREELELLANHDGPFVSFLQELGAWDPSGLTESPEDVLRRSQDAPVAFAHCNYLNPASLFHENSSIVYCPRTHAAFGHPPHPFRAFLERGVRVAFGTDSLASNPDLSILEEACYLHRLCPDFPGANLLRMATLSGAEALGWQDETGSLAAGKSADLVVLPLPDEEGGDPHRLIFESTAPVKAVLCRGRWVFGSSPGSLE